MPRSRTSSNDMEPASLYDKCLDFIINNIEDTIAHYDNNLDQLVLHEDVTLPHQLCEHLLNACTQSSYVLDDKFMHLFCDPTRTRLKRITVQDSYITDASLEFLMKHKPQELNISGCISLTGNAVSFINIDGEKLGTLLMGSAAPNVLGHLLDTYFPAETENTENQQANNTNATMEMEETNEVKYNLKVENSVRYKSNNINTTTKQTSVPDHILKCPALRAFSVHNLKENHLEDARVSRFFDILFNSLGNLTYLDISSCDVGQFEFLHHTPHLTTLILHNVPIFDLQQTASAIGNLGNIRVLDLSQDKESGEHVTYKNPEANMGLLASKLPHLTWLDLAGTNLCGFLKPKEIGHRPKPIPGDEDYVCAIPGLEGKYLDFLGLLNCPYEACQRDDLPAREITGDANESQVVLSVQLYLMRPELLLKSLNNMFAVFKYHECVDQIPALHAIVTAMKKHPFNKTIQISGSASLFYIIKGSEKDQLTQEQKRLVIKVILDGMDSNMDEATMLRNGCLTLCHLKIPQDVLFDYERMVAILLRMVAPPQPEEFVQRIGIYLLNSLACQVDGKEKQLVGDLGAISVGGLHRQHLGDIGLLHTMLQIITYKLEVQQCDEVMEIAWSTMWNVTDETAINCERFIDGNGMKLFLTCLDKFPDKEELLRNMMGLMGNIAEVDHLRPRLLQSEYVRQFSNLLLSTSDGIEVSYNACGVLAHLVADGEAVWTIQEPSRSSVLQKMVDAISRWNLKTNRNINYRSFEPILRLLPKYDTSEAQHWAVWALCNLTKMYRDKYCPLLEKEGGTALLREVAESSRPYSVIRSLAAQIIERCRRFKENPDYRSDGEDVAEEEEEEEMYG